MTDAADHPRCGFVALVGAPNAGKSTLTNALVGTKVSIVTHKVQTTRARITAIALEGASQLIFVDTPGIFRPKKRLERAMVDAAWSGATDADLVVLLVDAKAGLTGEVEDIVAGLAAAGRPAILALNKVDTASRDALLALTADLNARHTFTDTFMISALTGDGVADLRAHLAAQVPAGPWLYPEDQLSDITDRLMAAEITREKLFLRVHDELPYALTVETEQFKTQKDGSIRIEQTIFVQRDSHKRMVIGKGGAMLKTVGQLAREEMTAVFETKVHLFLFVKVREKWQDDPERYREMGLDWDG